MNKPQGLPYPRKHSVRIEGREGGGTTVPQGGKELQKKKEPTPKKKKKKKEERVMTSAREYWSPE